MDASSSMLKSTAAALDGHRVTRTEKLKLRVQRAEYAIDPGTVAEAMIRHAVSHRRWWNPPTTRRAPPALSTTSAGPSATVPIQVSVAADSVAERSPRPTQTHSS